MNDGSVGGVTAAMKPASALIVREVFGSTAASSLVRGPSQRTVLPEASYQWRLRFTGFAPAVFQVWLPVFVSATAICAFAPAGIAVGGVATTYVALCGNHATPSFTSAKLRRYAPGVGGAATVALRVWLPPTATSASNGVRGPSHMTAPPTASYQW